MRINRPRLFAVVAALVALVAGCKPPPPQMSREEIRARLSQIEARQAQAAAPPAYAPPPAPTYAAANTEEAYCAQQLQAAGLRPADTPWFLDEYSALCARNQVSMSQLLPVAQRLTAVEGGRAGRVLAGLQTLSKYARKRPLVGVWKVALGIVAGDSGAAATGALLGDAFHDSRTGETENTEDLYMVLARLSPR